MPIWWVKSKEVKERKKSKRESIIDAIQQKFKNASEKMRNDKSKGSRRHVIGTRSEKQSQSVVASRISSPSSTYVSRCRSFSELERPLFQQLPLSGSHLPAVSDANSGICLPSRMERASGSKQSLYCPLPASGVVSNRGYPTDAEGYIDTASVSSDSSGYSGDSSDSHLISHLATDYEIGNRATINRSFRLVHRNRSPVTFQNDLGASSSPAPQMCGVKNPSTSPKRSRLHLPNLKIGRTCGLFSAQERSTSSPSKSPVRALGPDQLFNSALWTGKPCPYAASGNYSSPGSGQNSDVGDLPGQVILPLNRYSPECSPIPSPRMTSHGPRSRIQGGAVTPLHPRAGTFPLEITTRHPDDVTQKTHPLPLPPITVTSYCLSPNYSSSTTPSAPRSPARAEIQTSQVSRWKKGKLLGRGTFGHVYLGFDSSLICSESGEMCAMKEVTLFADDDKSRECAQQLQQEIMLLSQLQHPNIVRYYGSETVEDKLYIYLEYVSAGSIYKLLREYGQLGENAIRNYTRQILLGLAYLHAKNTVHRDIKGANILVDPNGQIKLADFGMAKHITGESCPFSFKGSPHWMAPEVVHNSNDCNLAVDIWSLGCTVLEMATTKPPWSQFEGVAAIFKILQMKKLPEAPEHLSEDGKDFVRLCLQRNPQDRPSAVQLLEHPFVKKATLERTILTVHPSEASPAIVDELKSLAIGPAKHNLCLESEMAAGTSRPRRLRIGSASSDVHTPRNMSCPVSPLGQRTLPLGTFDVAGRVSTVPVVSPRTTSGLSTPFNDSGRTISFHRNKQPMFSHETACLMPRSQGGFHYQDPTHDALRVTRPSQDVIISSDDDVLATNYKRVVRREFYNVPQTPTRDCVRMSTYLDCRASTPRQGPTTQMACHLHVSDLRGHRACE
ncbi:mitogen-activated protein kinase kinase kinase YODA isoform X1 [Arachis ipaensis]|uniref:mitogen-activated protein kinase kinase kinase YODA isoform X1 n=1 Tax=Arachis ipaensis TaxID=130454 RepID=UPI000A2B6059|nr:mitogen-activated protein kinase kinase kinase YODA isoform X1 [Arachis ipaensis]XP_020974818.1 mitogen-activated protein kinase kinase kinase YODA isoform X1 [Arachis ipaensis]XP_020974819.1 mitogen-activated protein kinase kinase kinase YODA isoform X1 [Arachis ipaensis]